MSANNHHSIPSPPEQRVAALESALEALVPGAKAFVDEHVRMLVVAYSPGSAAPAEHSLARASKSPARVDISLKSMTKLARGYSTCPSI